MSCDQVGNSQSTAETNNNDQIVAVANIKSTADSNLSGIVTLIQNQFPSKILPTVEVKAEVTWSTAQ